MSSSWSSGPRPGDTPSDRDETEQVPPNQQGSAAGDGDPRGPDAGEGGWPTVPVSRPPQPPPGGPTAATPSERTAPLHSGAMTTARPPQTRAAEAPASKPVRRRAAAPVRRTRVLRKIDPWSVLKLSLVFYFCALLVAMLALAVFWAIVNRIGVVDQLLDFLADLQLLVTIDGGMIARALFLIGLLNVILWSGVNVFLAFLYNLIADLVGGLRVGVLEED